MLDIIWIIEDVQMIFLLNIEQNVSSPFLSIFGKSNMFKLNSFKCKYYPNFS